MQHIYKITELGQSEEEEDDAEDLDPEEKRKRDGRRRTRKSRAKTLFYAPLEKLASMRFAVYCDDTDTAKRKTTICVDPDSEHLPPFDARKPMANHDIAMSRLYMDWVTQEQSRYCLIDLAGILTRSGAQRFIDADGVISGVNSDKDVKQLAQARNLIPIYPDEAALVPPVDGVRTDPFLGATCSCWNQYTFPYLWTLLKMTAELYGIDVGRMRAKSLRLTNVNLVYQSKHKVVKEAFTLLMKRHIHMHVLCSTDDMECLKFGEQDQSLWQLLSSVRYNHGFVYPPLQFVKSSYSQLAKIEAFGFKRPCTLLMQHRLMTGPQFNAESPEVWEHQTWVSLFQETMARFATMYASEPNVHHKNSFLKESKIMENGIVAKASSDHSGEKYVLMKPKMTALGELDPNNIETTLLLSGNRLATRARDHFAHDECILMEPYTRAAFTTGMDTYWFFEKNYLTEVGYVKLKIDHTKRGSARFKRVKTRCVLPHQPWKSNQRTNRHSYGKELNECMAAPSFRVTRKINLPVVAHFYNIKREGTATCPTLMNIQPFPAGGVRTAAAFPTHQFVLTLTRRVATYFVTAMQNDGAKW